MANLTAYGTGTPKASDLLLGTKTAAPNTNEENITQNFTVSSVAAFANSTAAYTAYSARLNASSSAGGATPTINLLANNTSLAFAWTRTNIGAYTATITGGTAPENKVWFTAGSGGGNDYQKLSWGAPTELELRNYDGTGLIAEGLNEVYIEIRIYS
jgi:hypothetical protein